MDNKIIDKINKKFPYTTLNLELTNACNLHCPLCSTGSGFNTKPKGRMEFSRYKKLLDTFSPLITTIELIGSGEPFLHTEITDFIAYAKSKKIWTTCYTNGTVMNEPEKIVKSGLNVIQITLDGLTQEQHQIYRKGSDLEIVLKNIRSLVLARKKLHSFWPKIYINTLINKHNEKDYRLFIKQAKKLSVNGIKFTGIIDDLFKTSDLLPLSGKFKHSPRKNGYKCRFQKLIFGILSWDGDIQLCCLTPNHNNPVIKCNAFEEKDLLKTLDSEEFLNLTKKSGNYQFCEECFLKNNSSYLKEIALDWMPIWLLRRLTILKRDPLKATSLFIRKILNS